MSEEFKKYNSKEVKKSQYAEREEEVLEYWHDNNIFQKTLDKKSTEGDFVFYEGPPTANGRPGIHHILARSFKDAIPRYKTMSGYRVHRRAGWDTHGLPVELQVEKELGLASKKDIEEYGIAKFNKACKDSVWTYKSEWEHMTQRMGYWVDLDNPYVTYKKDYVESLWWVAKQIADQDLLFKDYKVVPWCPRCGTGLSSHELAQGYKDVKDISITAKFVMKNPADHDLPDGTALVAWTTTPWTLPGNVALAVGNDIDYVLNEDNVIFAKNLMEKMTGTSHNIVKEFKGKDLVGLEYEPLFPYFAELAEKNNVTNLDNAYQVYAADFVTTEDGTGIVHTAVMYGQDDFELGNQIGLPKMHLVTENGTFVDGAGNLTGRFVKEEIDGKPTMDVDIIKHLQEHDTFFAKEKYEHSYPHCWRCKTPLIYYARDSWYVNMQQVKDTLIAENKKINWEPSHVGEGRFGEWLADVKDWAISRERYWGTPLPVWQSEDGDQIVVGGYDDLKKYGKKSTNQYFFMRHGEAEHNVKSIANSDPNQEYNLTEKGEQQARTSAEQLKDKGITKIYHSPLPRGHQTASIVAEVLGIAPENLIEDSRLRELGYGSIGELDFDEFRNWRDNIADDFYMNSVGGDGESYYDVKKRLGDLWHEVNDTLSDEVVLFVGHGAQLEVAPAIAEYAHIDHAKEIFKESKKHTTGVVQQINLQPLPHNENYELDPHRPFIDDFVLEKDGKEFHRVPEVMDVWFDSGCMPFAQEHYPFENKDYIDGPGFPADFICEGMDQTRGWFYTLHAVGNLLGRGHAYKNVISVGLINDENGQKMSKSRGNTVNPWDAMNEYGIDTIRYWMYSVNSPGEAKNFDPKTIVEVQRKVFGLLDNVVNFYEMYADNIDTSVGPYYSPNILDQWILAKLDDLIDVCTKHIDQYQLLEPTREIREFIADLSQWYIRRSRDRFKTDGEDKKYALATTQSVLSQLACLLAPFTPFFAENVYKRVGGNLESVHLEDWPSGQNEDNVHMLENMSTTRDIISRALELRAKSGIKVRQPLATLTITKELSDDYTDLVKDEVNVKEVLFGDDLQLDTEITPKLQAEGNARELIRSIQSMRKKAGLSPEDEITLSIDTNDAGKQIVDAYKEDITTTAGIRECLFESNDGQEVVVNDLKFKLVIQ